MSTTPDDDFLRELLAERFRPSGRRPPPPPRLDTPQVIEQRRRILDDALTEQNRGNVIQFRPRNAA